MKNIKNLFEIAKREELVLKEKKIEISKRNIDF